MFLSCYLAGLTTNDVLRPCIPRSTNLPTELSMVDKTFGGMLALRFGSFKAGGEWRIGCIVSSSRGEGRGPKISLAWRSYCDLRAQVKRVRLKS